MNCHTQHDLDAERMLAGSVMLSETEFDTAAGIVSADEMLDELAAAIFKAAASLRSKDQRISPADVFVELKASGQLAKLGSDAREIVFRLAIEAGAGANVASVAEAVRDSADRRKLRAIAAELLNDTTRHTGESAAELAAKFERELQALADQRSLSGPVPIAKAMADEFKRIDATACGEIFSDAVPTPFLDLNRMCGGGLLPGTLTVLAARPACGKTALALRFAESAARNGHGVLFVSLEMSNRELMGRLLSMCAGVPLPAIRRADLTPQQSEKLLALKNTGGLADAELFLDDRVPQSMAQVAATTRQYARRHGVKLLILDYLGLLTPADRRAARYLQVGEDARALKTLAKQAGIAVLCLAQLNRQSVNRADGEPLLSDLRDSGEVEQHADNVLLLHRLDKDTDTAAPTYGVDLIAAKMRNGPTGRIPLEFVRAQTKFQPRSENPATNW
jgi:replicative DNA helicase